MPSNRLHLDWKLNYFDERNEFIKQYTQLPEFKKQPPTPEEWETMANYILWGKERETGKAIADPESLGLPAKNGDWSKTKKTESLDALMEQPGFNEANFCTKNRPPLKIKREKFLRSETRKECPAWLLPEFEELWGWIDDLDLKIGLYELKSGKRVKPIREQLLKKFDETQIAAANKSIESWTPYYYLKQRHELVDLRRRQYALRDSYRAGTIFAYETYNEVREEPDWEAGIEVLPMGIAGDDKISKIAFAPWDDIHPGLIRDPQMAKDFTKWYWKKKDWKETGTLKSLDFRNPDHVYAMFQQFYELKDSGEERELTRQLMATLEYYMAAAELPDLQREILDAKLKHEKNIDIAIKINKKYDKSYTPNYISTIFKQRIVPKICDAARVHEEKLGCIWFEEEWKKCSTCGRILLRNEDNFTHKARSRDGFASRCKACEKAARLKNK